MDSASILQHPRRNLGSRHRSQADRFVKLAKKDPERKDENLAWAEQNEADGLIDLFADSRAIFTELLGLKTDMGAVLGIRASRSAFVVDNGLITHFFKEEPKAYEVSDAESLLSAVSG